MFEKLKAKIAAKRVQRIKDFNDTDKKIKRNESKEKQMLLYPFRLTARLLRWILDNFISILSWLWECICEINLFGLLNLTLLIAIIVLLSMFVTSITNCGKRNVVVMGPAKDVAVEYTETPTLPLKHISTPGNKNKYTNCHTKANSKQKIQHTERHTVYGDTVIETSQEQKMLHHGTVINGNLYLQNMRKYVLPCNVKINGNLFLRNVRMLQFCGKFDVSGNIYVNPTSSFGPLPPDAILGGQVIL